MWASDQGLTVKLEGRKIFLRKKSENFGREHNSEPQKMAGTHRKKGPKKGLKTNIPRKTNGIPLDFSLKVKFE
jgi:hypothetical protein